MPTTRWTIYGRWSDDGKVCFASHPWVSKCAFAPVIFRHAGKG